MCTRKKNRNCLTGAQRGREFCFVLSTWGEKNFNLFRREDNDVSRDGETDRQTDRDGGTDRQREREGDRLTDRGERERSRARERRRDRQRDRDAETERDGETDNRQSGKQTAEYHGGTYVPPAPAQKTENTYRQTNHTKVSRAEVGPYARLVQPLYRKPRTRTDRLTTQMYPALK